MKHTTQWRRLSLALIWAIIFSAAAAEAEMVVNTTLKAHNLKTQNLVGTVGAPEHKGAVTDDAATTLEAAQDIFVSGNFAYVTAFEGDGVEILDLSGIEAPSATIGALSAGDVEVTDNARVGNSLMVRGGVNVGRGGIRSDGPVTIEGLLRLAPQVWPPPNPSEGQVFFGTDGHLHVYSGGAWHSLNMTMDP
jgi:hypothetical protein